MDKLFSNSGSSFGNNIIKQNIVKILIVGGVYCSFELVGLLMSTFGFFESDIRIYVASIVLFHIIYLPSLYLMNKFYDLSVKKNLKVLRVMEGSYYYVIALWGSLFTALMYLDKGDITIYAIVTMLIAAMFVLKPIINRTLYGVNFILFSVMIVIQVDNALIVNELIFKTLIVTVIASVIAQTNFVIRKNLFDSQKQLVDMNVTLRDQALRDSLTGLYNNGYMFDFIEKAIRTQDRCGGNFSLLMVDIDDFKGVNDKFGHLFGDQVIRQVSNKLMELTRSQDVVGRYGGEEFIVVLCDTDLNLAMEIGERIRKEILGIQFEENTRVSVSIGISEFSNQDTIGLIKQADENLYKAKDAGKNRVVA